MEQGKIWVLDQIYRFTQTKTRIIHRSNFAGEASTTATMLVSLLFQRTQSYPFFDHCNQFCISLFVQRTITFLLFGWTDLNISMQHLDLGPNIYMGNFIWTSAGANNLPAICYFNCLVLGLNVRALLAIWSRHMP